MVKLCEIDRHFPDGMSRNADALLRRMIREHGTQAIVSLSLEGDDVDHARLWNMLDRLRSGKIHPIYRW